MKIICEDNLFIEREDLKFGYIPRVIERELPTNVFSGFTLLSKKAGEYFSKCDYIIDYQDIKDLSFAELNQKESDLKENMDKLSLRILELKQRGRETEAYQLGISMQKVSFMVDTLDRYKNNKDIIDEDAKEILDEKRMY